MLDHGIIEREVCVILTMCIVSVAAARLTLDQIHSSQVWLDFFREICARDLTTILSLHAFTWSTFIIPFSPFVVKNVRSPFKCTRLIEIQSRFSFQTRRLAFHPRISDRFLKKYRFFLSAYLGELRNNFFLKNYPSHSLSL